MSKIFVFRVDSSHLIGSGHVMRCLTFADSLKKLGHTVIFICRDYPNNLIQVIKARGFKVYILDFHENEAYLRYEVNDDYSKWLWVSQEQDINETLEVIKELGQVKILVVDHYALDIKWESKISEHVEEILVIDDLANRSHCCNYLLDQNYYPNQEQRYNNLVPEDCKKFLGPSYAIIKPELLKVKESRQKLNKTKAIKNILVFLGGADPKNYTAKLIETLLKLSDIEHYSINIIVGAINPHKEIIQQLCQSYPFLHYYCQPENYYELLTEADLAVAAGGSSMWERCFIGLPSILLALSANQLPICAGAEELGISIFCRDFNDLQGLIQPILSRPDSNKLIQIANKGMKVVDGKGILKLIKEVV